MRLSDNRPTVGAYERPLSFSTIVTLRPLWPRLLSPSNAMPPVMDPSPMTATTRRLPPVVASAVASPWAYARTVEAWEFSIQSWPDSAREG